ncbi:hypothetical protein CRYUN_Cryun28dG0111400 [Craigia yunnanensis]
MAGQGIWQPKGEGLREICGVLEQHISPTSDKPRISQQLQHYSQFPDFNNYLVFIFAHAQLKGDESLSVFQVWKGASVEIRQAAGLLLKNNLRSAFKSLDAAYQQYIKLQLLPCLGQAEKDIRNTVGTFISVIVQQGRILGWPELLQALVQCFDSNDINHMEGALDTLSKICEDIPQELDSDIHCLSEKLIDVFLPRLLQSPHASLRKLSLGSVNQFVMLMPTALYLSMDQYLQGLFVLSHDPVAEVRKLVCAALVQLIEVNPSFLEVCPSYLHPCLSEFLNVAAKQMVRQEVSPIVMTIVSSIVMVLQHPEGVNRSLVENSAITLGRLAWVCPEIVSPHMEHFMKEWCTALSMIRDDIEKEDVFRGLCAIAIRSEELHKEVCQVLLGYKQILKDGTWEQCLSTLEPQVKEILSKYGV